MGKSLSLKTLPGKLSKHWVRWIAFFILSRNHDAFSLHLFRNLCQYHHMQIPSSEKLGAPVCVRTCRQSGTALRESKH